MITTEKEVWEFIGWYRQAVGRGEHPDAKAVKEKFGVDLIGEYMCDVKGGRPPNEWACVSTFFTLFDWAIHKVRGLHGPSCHSVTSTFRGHERKCGHFASGHEAGSGRCLSCGCKSFYRSRPPADPQSKLG